MPLRIEERHDGGLVQLTLDRPRANVLDAELVGALRGAVRELARRRELRLVLIAAEGPHFSFGASVEEHLPGAVDEMLANFHALFRELEGLGRPTAAAVRGQCLGGGLELAAWCGRVVCAPGARFALPEIQLGVFPPLGTQALRWRVGGSRATELVITGAAVEAERALALGLVDEVADDPVAALDAWYTARLAPLSAEALSMAWRAARRPMLRWLHEELPRVEALYLDELMSLSDPVEGLRAFLEKRPPRWSA